MINHIFREPKYKIGDIVTININTLKKKLRKKQIFSQAFMEICQFNNNSIGQHIITRISKKNNGVNMYNLDGLYMLEENEINRLQRGSQIYYIYKVKDKFIEVFTMKQKYKAEDYCSKHKDWNFIIGDKINTIQQEIYIKENKFKPFKLIHK